MLKTNGIKFSKIAEGQYTINIYMSITDYSTYFPFLLLFLIFFRQSED